MSDRNAPSLHMDTFLFPFFRPYRFCSLVQASFAGAIASGPQSCTPPFRRLPDLLREAERAHLRPQSTVRTLLTTTIHCEWRLPVNLPLPQCLASLLLSHFPLAHFRPKQTPHRLCSTSSSIRTSCSGATSFLRSWQHTILLHTPFLPSFRRHPWPPVAPFQHHFAIGHLLSHATCRFFLGYCSLFFVRGVRPSPHPSEVDSSLVGPDLRS